MSEHDFDTLVTLIQNLIAYGSEMQAHPMDGPRMERAYREREQAIEYARSILVL